MMQLGRLCGRSLRPILNYIPGVFQTANVTTVSTETNSTEQEVAQELPNDAFSKEFQQNRILLTGVQKTILSIGSSIAALVDPTRHDMIACLGETTGDGALKDILDIMQNDQEGRQILLERPRINTRTIDLDKLRELPENTFGRAYVKFLDDNKVTPDSRMEVRFIENPNLAYVMTRYRECHDLVHTVLGMPTNMLGEVAVKWFEAFNTGLPMCYGGAVFGAVRLRPKQRKQYLSKYLPWAIANGKSAKFLLSIYWEKRWEQDFKHLQDELGIIAFEK